MGFQRDGFSKGLEFLQGILSNQFPIRLLRTNRFVLLYLFIMSNLKITINTQIYSNISNSCRAGCVGTVEYGTTA